MIITLPVRLPLFVFFSAPLRTKSLELITPSENCKTRVKQGTRRVGFSIKVENKHVYTLRTIRSSSPAHDCSNTDIEDQDPANPRVETPLSLHDSNSHGDGLRMRLGHSTDMSSGRSENLQHSHWLTGIHIEHNLEYDLVFSVSEVCEIFRLQTGVKESCGVYNSRTSE